ncbi:hypothetical protein DFH09DRAFT_1159388 [Mycena vulgaris]|nr:hypothetical protein DFH09DRAFT_1159388 [Mycena vulgaris]
MALADLRERFGLRRTPQLEDEDEELRVRVHTELGRTELENAELEDAELAVREREGAERARWVQRLGDFSAELGRLMRRAGCMIVFGVRSTGLENACSRSEGSMGAQLDARFPWKEDAGLEDAVLGVRTRTWCTIILGRGAATQADAGSPHPILSCGYKVASPVVMRSSWRRAASLGTR